MVLNEDGFLVREGLSFMLKVKYAGGNKVNATCNNPDGCPRHIYFSLIRWAYAATDWACHGIRLQR